MDTWPKSLQYYVKIEDKLDECVLECHHITSERFSVNERPKVQFSSPTRNQIFTFGHSIPVQLIVDDSDYRIFLHCPFFFLFDFILYQGDTITVTVYRQIDFFPDSAYTSTAFFSSVIDTSFPTSKNWDTSNKYYISVEYNCIVELFCDYATSELFSVVEGSNDIAQVCLFIIFFT